MLLNGAAVPLKSSCVFLVRFPYAFTLAFSLGEHISSSGGLEAAPIQTIRSNSGGHRMLLPCCEVRDIPDFIPDFTV